VVLLVHGSEIYTLSRVKKK
jgi:hypothetical protein